MLEVLFSGGGASADFATVAIRLPKAMHVEMSALAQLHGLSLQAVGKASLDAALIELRAAPKPADAATDSPATVAATPPVASVATTDSDKGKGKPSGKGK